MELDIDLSSIPNGLRPLVLNAGALGRKVTELFFISWSYSEDDYFSMQATITPLPTFGSCSDACRCIGASVGISASTAHASSEGEFDGIGELVKIRRIMPGFDERGGECPARFRPGPSGIGPAAAFFAAAASRRRFLWRFSAVGASGSFVLR